MISKEYRIFRFATDCSCNIADMLYEDINQAVEYYITALFKLYPNEKLVYHNFEHTRKVVERVNEIALFCKLDTEQFFVMRSAAWFHDIGFLFSGPAEHEREGVRLLNEFVSDIISTQTPIGEIEGCIMGTKRSPFLSPLQKRSCVTQNPIILERLNSN